MKIFNILAIIMVILLLVLMYGIHRDIQNIKQQLGVDSVETDNASDCMVFPCYTSPHKQWVSEKYLTKRKGVM